MNNTIVSRITANVGTLRSLSNIEQPDFTIFTHKKKFMEGEPVPKTYKELREAVLELFL